MADDDSTSKEEPDVAPEQGTLTPLPSHLANAPPGGQPMPMAPGVQPPGVHLQFGSPNLDQLVAQRLDPTQLHQILQRQQDLEDKKVEVQREALTKQIDGQAANDERKHEIAKLQEARKTQIVTETLKQQGRGPTHFYVVLVVLGLLFGAVFLKAGVDAALKVTLQLGALVLSAYAGAGAQIMKSKREQQLQEREAPTP